MRKKKEQKRVPKKRGPKPKKRATTQKKKETSRPSGQPSRTATPERKGFLRGAKRHFGSSSTEKPTFVSIPEGEEVILRMFGKPIIRMLHWPTIRNTKGQSYVIPIACSDYDYDISSWDGEKVRDDCPLCKGELEEATIEGVSYHPKYSDSTMSFRAMVLCIDRSIQKEQGTFDAIKIYCMSPMVYNRLIEFATPQEENEEFVSVKFRGDPLSTRSGYSIRIQNTGSSNTKEYYLIDPSKKDSPLTSEEIKEIKRWQEEHPEWIPEDYYKLRDESEILQFLEDSVAASDDSESSTYRKAARVSKEEEFSDELDKEENKEEPADPLEEEPPEGDSSEDEFI